VRVQRSDDSEAGGMLRADRPCRRAPGWAARAILLPLLASLPGASASSAPLPVSATLEIRLAAQIGDEVETLDEVLESATFTFPTEQPLTLAGEALSTAGAGFARAYQAVSAVVTPFAGSVTLEAGIEAVNPSRANVVAVVTGGHAPWSYTFIPDADGVLVFDYLDYDQTAGNLSFTSSGRASVYLLGSGSIERDLLAGVPYTIGLDLFAGPSCFGGCEGAHSGSATFSWTIVPEPSTLPAAASGLLALALGRRACGRRRAAAGA
jgi:hypothetical protein